MKSKITADMSYIKTVLKEHEIKIVNCRNLPHVKNLLYSTARIFPSVVSDAYSRISFLYKSVPVHKFIDSLSFCLNSPLYASTSTNVSTRSNSSYALKLLTKLKGIHQNEKELFHQICWLIEIVTKGKLYDQMTIPVKPLLSSRPSSRLDSAGRARSTLALENKSKNISFAKIEGGFNNLTITNRPKSPHFVSIKNLYDIVNEFEQNQNLVNSLETLNFNIFETQKFFIRNEILPMISYTLFARRELADYFEKEILEKFIWSISEGCNKTIYYHNDLHASDLMQLCFYFLNKSKNVIKLKKIEEIAFLTSAMIVHYKHVGTNNAYEIKTKSKIAKIYYNNSPIQNYIISQVFKNLNLDSFSKLTSKICEDEEKTFLNIIKKCILSTDSKKHEKYVKIVTKKIQLQEKLFTEEDALREIFLNSDDIVLIFHGLYLANQGRPFVIAKKWSNCFIEEKYELKNRSEEENIDVGININFPNYKIDEINFINEILLPYFNSLNKLYFGFDEIIENMNSNLNYWINASN